MISTTTTKIFSVNKTMQTRKKIVARNTDREHASPRFCRYQKKVAVVAEKKVAELITSSARKQKPAGILSWKNNDAESAKNLSTNYVLSSDKSQDICTLNQVPLDLKRVDGRDAQSTSDSIFSPAFHMTKDVCGAIPENDFMGTFGSKDQIGHHNCQIEESKASALACHVTSTKEHSNSSRSKTEELPSTCPPDSMRPLEKSDAHNSYESMTETNEISSCKEDYHVVGTLSSEVSAIYLAMQNSKLECVEPCQDSISTEGAMDVDEGDDFDDFDPYLFIRNLPDLSVVVPTFRPMLLPKQTRSCPPTSLVLDLDETLVHSTLEPCEDADFTFSVNFNFKDHTVYVRCRPYLKDFLERVSGLFEITIFTASQSIYAEQLLNVLDPKRRLFRHRVYRESCVFVDGNYLKDLSVLGRDLARVVIVDNSPQAFGFQVDNGIPIESWFDDRSDQELLSLLPFLESLIEVEDVRPLIAKKFNLRDKITAAVCPSLVFSK